MHDQRALRTQWQSSDPVCGRSKLLRGSDTDHIGPVRDAAGTAPLRSTAGRRERRGRRSRERRERRGRRERGRRGRWEGRERRGGRGGGRRGGTGPAGGGGGATGAPASWPAGG